MARPGIHISGKANLPAKAKPKKPTGLPKPQSEKDKTNTPLSQAKKAVQEYEVQRRVLDEMRKDWEENYPEALLAQRDVLEQEDRVHNAIKIAKPLVAAAKETVGDFKAQPKFSRPRYDATEVTKIVSSHKSGIEILREMLDDGVVKVIDLNGDHAIAWFAVRPEYSEVFQPAFREKEEMTTAVTVPKI